jgi:predicted acetyltransferase
MTAAKQAGPASIEVRPVAAIEITAFVDTVATAWGFDSSEEERQRDSLDLAGESLLGAFAAGVMAGTAMSFSLELTVPGQVQVPMAGVSWVAVHPLHRRQGILRALMRAQLDDLHARGVPLAGLGASEAGIYGRFGYGPATWDSTWRLARGAARHLAGADQLSRLELVDAATAREVLPSVHERARRSQVGEVRAHPGWWRDHTADEKRAGRQFVVYRDHDGGASGYASYRLERDQRWSSRATVVVDHLAACTAAAYHGLWAYLADLDLTDSVEAHGRPEHEPLQWALADSRQLEVTDVHDHLWVRLVDLPEALSRRRYGGEGSVVLEVTDPFCPWNQGRWLLDGGPDGAACQPAPAPAAGTGTGGDGLRLDVSALGSLLLGGTSVARLAAAGLVQADPASLLRANQMFGTGLDPWCSTWF